MSKNLNHLILATAAFAVFSSTAVLAESSKAPVKAEAKAEMAENATVSSEDKQKVALAKQILNLHVQNAVFDLTTSLLESKILPDIRHENPGQDDKIDDCVVAAEMEAFGAYEQQLNAKDAPAYAAAFSLDDLQAQLAFYKSSAGTYYLARMTDPKTEVPKPDETQIKNFYKSPVGARITKAKLKTSGPDEETIIQIQQLTPHILASEIRKAGLNVPKDMEPQ